jgi:hypothetical protein
MPSEAPAIQVRVRELRQLFNSMDPSPFRERDLDPACEEFIVAWAREMPPERELRLEIWLEHEQPPPEVAADVPPAVRGHFARAASLTDLRRRRIVREGRLSLLIGLAALVLCLSAAAVLPAARLGTAGLILRESLIIAGWVVMWHPLEVLLYGIWPVVRERRLLGRLAAADVRLATSAAPHPSAAAVIEPRAPSGGTA